MSPRTIALVTSLTAALLTYIIPFAWIALAPEAGGGQPCMPVSGKGFGFALWLIFGLGAALALGLVCGGLAYVIARIDSIPNGLILLEVPLLVGVTLWSMIGPGPDRGMASGERRREEVMTLINAGDVDGLDALGRGSIGARAITLVVGQQLKRVNSMDDDQLSMLTWFYRRRNKHATADHMDILIQLETEWARRAGGLTKVPGWDSEPRALFQRFKDGRNRVRVQLKDPVQLEGLHTLAVAQSGVEGVGWDARRVAVASGVRFLKDLTPLVDRFQAQMTRHGDPGLAAFMLASAVDQEAASMRPSGGRLSGTERQALNNLLTALRAWEGEELHHSSKQDIEAYVRATARDAGRL